MAGNMPSALDSLVAQFGIEIVQHRSDALSVLSSKLAALLAESKMISLQDAAHELHAGHEEVESCARGDPRMFGVLGGPTPALFQPVQAE